MIAKEREGRQAKALAMVAVIDSDAIQKSKLDPFDQAGRILLASLDWPDRVWERIGERAGYKRKAISALTREEVRNVYRGRAKAPLARRAAS